MSEQAQEQDLTPSMQMQEMMAQMAQMRAEIDSLKQRAQALPQIEEPLNSAPVLSITSTRRKTLKRWGLALLGGAAAATATGFSAAEAKLVANPGTSKVGALVLSPNAPVPTYNTRNYQYGLVALAPSDTTNPFNLTNLPSGGTGVYGNGGTTGIYGEGGVNGVYGKTGDSGSYGVSGNGGAYGVRGDGSSFGVYGYSGNGTGVRGSGGTTGVFGSSSNTGVRGEGSSYGVFGRATGPGSGVGSAGVWGEGGTYAGYFFGAVNVVTTLYAADKQFKIDHPLDPANKYLYHTSVESPDMKNIYDGVVTLNEQGAAVVTMPDWFEALNTDFRYQLTSIGVSMPNLFIAEEMKERKFKIAGGLPGQRVSWMVTGIRQDAYAKAQRSPVEQDKSEAEKGLYLHPEAFGKSENMSLSNHFRPM